MVGSNPRPEEIPLEDILDKIEKKGRVNPPVKLQKKSKAFLPAIVASASIITLLTIDLISNLLFKPFSGGTTPTQVYQPTATISQPLGSSPTPQQVYNIPTLQQAIDNTPAPLLSPYAIISLQSYSVFSSPATSLGLPIGNQTLLNIPFEIGWGLKTPCTSDPNVPAQYNIKTNLEGITKLHFLIQGGWAVSDYANKEIGDIVLNFSNGAHSTTPLIVGNNIRDWSIDNQTAVTTVTDPSVQEAWRGQDVNGNGRMDVLTLELPQEYANLTLTNIVLTDTTASTLGSVNPCFYVNAITAEKGQPAAQQQPTSTIPQELVDRLATYGPVSVTDVQNCLNTVSLDRTNNEIAANQTVPAGAIFATDFGGAGKKWSDYPVIPICYSGSWGIFQSTQEFVAPYKGAYYPIAPYSSTQPAVEPLITPISISIGTGALANATDSDGSMPYSEDWLWANNHHKIQRIRIQEQPSGCDIARYDADKIWIAAGYPADFLVNGQVIGHYNYQPNSHGFIISSPVKKGDQLCVSPVSPKGFQIVFGPDVYYHYDSYCYRGHC